MEIVEIAKGRLKVTLNREELQTFSVDLDRMDYDSAETRVALEGILAVVRAKTDLETEEGKTFVQLYPSRDGGCELFLIHTDASEEGRDLALVPFREQKGYLCALSGRQDAEFFSKLLLARGFDGTRHYVDPQIDKHFFYLPAREEHLLFLEEFGVPADPMLKSYLAEHFEPT